MKGIILLFAFVPTLSLASIYNCRGAGFTVDVTAGPLEMKIVGNGLNGMVSNVRTSLTFDTVYSGNIINPPASVKLTVKDSSFGSPGDRFKSTLQLSSSAGIQEYSDLECIRGND